MKEKTYGYAVETVQVTPHGHYRLQPGEEIKMGDLMWRGMYQNFIPLSPSQMKTCGHVLNGEYIIRPEANK